MPRVVWFLPVAALVGLVGFLGYRAGQVPTETQIINRYAAIYLDQSKEGAQPTDCAAAPYPDPVIRLMITCAHRSGEITTFFVGARGRALPPPAAPRS